MICYMNYKERMKVGVSQAEVQLHIALETRGLTKLMNPKGTAIVFIGKQALVVSPERLTKQLLENADGFTIPDFPFLDYKIPVYLDGPPHMKRGVLNRDDRINEMLRTHEPKFNPLRFRHNGGKMSSVLVARICNRIRKEVE